MTTYLTDYLADGKNIPDSEREVIRYGVEGILNNLLGIFITVTVGIFCDCVFESCVFWISFWTLRKHAGGFHAKTKISMSDDVRSIVVCCFRIPIESRMDNRCIYVDYGNRKWVYLLPCTCRNT